MKGSVEKKKYKKKESRESQLKIRKEDDQNINIKGQNHLIGELLDGNPIEMSIWSNSLKKKSPHS